MRLIDFFGPLNLFNLMIFVMLFLFFDVLGTFIKNFLIKYEINLSRVVNWIIGLSFFIFIWFLLSFVTPYTTNNILLSIVILLCLTLPSYLLHRSYKSLISEIWNSKLIILTILPFLPSVFVKASLPPYYSDEMAYHFISPYAVTHLSPIKYVGGIYSDLPRMMNLFYEVIFSLTHTYSVARLFHFTVLVTGLIYTYKVLKDNFGWLIGFLFVFVFLSLPQDIVLTATLGYIDVAAYTFILISIASLIWFVMKPSKEPLFLMSIFWAMNLGTKYTGVSTFIVFIFLFIIILWFLRYRILNYLNTRSILFLLISIIVFGGYWYIKNFVLYGNPIFPFIFNCWGEHIEPCPQSGGFFGGWTTKINIENAYLILSQLFLKNKILHFFIALLPVFALFIKDKKVKILSIFMILAVILELAVLKYFSGFYVRYQQHMQLYILTALVITYCSPMTNKFVQIIARLAIIVMFASSLLFYVYTIRHVNSLKFLNWNEINYATGKMNIYDWIEFNFPRMNFTIKWCESRIDGQVKKLARFDPDLIWFEHDGLKRAFMLNCEYVNPPLYSDDISGLMKIANDNKLKFFISSYSRCLPDSEVVKMHPTERDDMYMLRKINNKIICNSTEIEPYLYYFDYEKVKL